MAQMLLPVRVETAYTLESYERYFRFSLAGNGNKAKKIIHYVALGIVALALVVELFGMLLGNAQELWFSFSLLLLVLGFYGYLYFVLPKQAYKKFPPRSRASQLFTFREEDFMVQINETQSNGESGYATHRYENLFKICETRGDIYLFVGKQQAYIIEKRNIRETSPEILAMFLASRVTPDKFRRF